MTTRVERDAKFEQFVAKLKDLGRVEVFIGVLASGDAQKPHHPPSRPTSDGGESPVRLSVPTQVDVATWNEFGVTIDGEEHVPERSFLRATIDLRHPQITSQAAKEFREVIIGKRSVRDAYERLGAFTVGLIQERISRGIAPENADSTKDRKGSSTPLVDTGQLRSAITHEVRG